MASFPFSGDAIMCSSVRSVYLLFYAASPDVCLFFVVLLLVVATGAAAGGAAGSENEEAVLAAERVVKAVGLVDFDFKTFENPALQR